MPRPRQPPTPLSSTDLVGKDKLQDSEMEGVFSLPPPAVQAAGNRSASKSYVQPTATGHTSPPVSPKDRQAGSILQRKRTLSGTNKPNLESQPPSPSPCDMDGALPPPPSRARKIIQMKPKSTSSVAKQTTQSSNKSTPTHKEVSTSASKRKQAQPSTSSAAGRKIARKTAHSIIERRRRSKMNEEFGVLKEMIPACAGLEMHKLAILQAGIEYVRYLEGCIEQLKAQNEHSQSRQSTLPEDESDDDEEDDDASMDVDPATQRAHGLRASSSAAVSESDIKSPSTATRLPSLQFQHPLPSFRNSSVATSATNSTYASPVLRPIQTTSSLPTPSAYPTSHFQTRSFAPMTQVQPAHSVSSSPVTTKTPVQTGVSPAFGAFHFSPDLSRTSTWSSVNGHAAQNRPSPSLLPLPQAAMPLTIPSPVPAYNNGPSHLGQHGVGSGDGHAEATASATLLMMTKDRRGSISTTRTGSGKGISVRDLLSS